MSKSPAALSGSFLFGRNDQEHKTRENQPASPKSEPRNGRILAWLSLRKTNKRIATEKHQ